MNKKNAWFGGITATLFTSSLLFASSMNQALAAQTVSQGISSSVTKSATVMGNLPVDQPVTVSIVLRANNQTQLTHYIHQTITPDSSNYRKFLTTQQFAQAYGQSPLVIDAIVAYFKIYGISAQVYPNNLDITLNGTAGQVNQAFGVVLQNMQWEGKKFFGTKESPKLPGNLGSPILAVLGLSNYAPFATNIAKTPAPLLNKLPLADTTGTVSTTPVGWESPQSVEQLYNISPVQQKGDLGQGQTLGIVTMASFNPNDAYAYWKAYGIKVPSKNRISLINVDGGAGTPSLNAGSGETTLDVEQSGSLAPDANIIVYQAPNTDYGFVDAFFRAVSDNQVGSLSASWGMSEDAVSTSIAQGQESPNYAQAFNEAFEEAAAQGISSFAATGDYGAYQAVSDVGTTDLSVGNPADSPYVTAAGGTTLPTSDSMIFQQLGISIPQERAWGYDYLYPLWKEFGASSEQTWAELAIGGSNGGYSNIFSEPNYQQSVSGVDHFHAVQWFTPTNNDTSWTFHVNPEVISGQSNGGRAMPDISMDGDPDTGYTVYSTLFGGDNWSVGWGGTSFVAPQLNGIAALINESNGARVGFWNPQIYRFAEQSNSPFTPLDATGTSNDNLYYTGTQGTIYNPATGLGTPDVAKLTAAFSFGQRE